MSVRESPATIKTDKPIVYFYYDIASPFSYFALEILDRYCGKEWPDVALDLRPCSLFHIRLWADNWPGPPANKMKMDILHRDMARMRMLYGVPLIPDNKQFPANASKCNELLAYFKVHHPELVLPATRAFFEAYWRDQEPPADPEIVAKYIGPLFPGGKDALMAIWNDKSKLESTENQELLQKFTKEASDMSSIGTPWMNVVKPLGGGKTKMEAFFGSDRMDHIAQFLELPWKGYIPPSAKAYPGTEVYYDSPDRDVSIMYKKVKPMLDALAAAHEETAKARH